MQVTLLKSKIHRATVTGASLHYEGSISLPPRLIELANLRQFEKVLVANVATGNRFETYVITGVDGEIRLNGAAARLGCPGDKLIIMAWGQMDEDLAAGFAPAVVLVDEHNQPRRD